MTLILKSLVINNYHSMQFQNTAAEQRMDELLRNATITQRINPPVNPHTFGEIQSAWDKIRSTRTKQLTHREQQQLLFNHYKAMRNRPTTHNVGKRHAKGQAKGVGQVLKHSFIKPQVHVETLFVSRQ